MCLAKDKSPLMRRHTSLFGAGSARNALRSHYGKHDVSMIPSPIRDYYLEMGVSQIHVSLHFHLISWCFPLQAPSLTWLKHEVMESAKSATPCDCSSNVLLEQRFPCFFSVCRDARPDAYLHICPRVMQYKMAVSLVLRILRDHHV